MQTVDKLPLPELPRGWVMAVNALDGYGCSWRHLKVIVSASKELDGKVWWHVSVSRQDWKLPSWEDLRKVKVDFIGKDKTALLVLPSQDKYVNLKEVHHLWHCLDGDVTPDFTHGTGSI